MRDFLIGMRSKLGDESFEDVAKDYEDRYHRHFSHLLIGWTDRYGKLRDTEEGSSPIV